MITSNGISFIAKQTALQRSNPKLATSTSKFGDPDLIDGNSIRS